MTAEKVRKKFTRRFHLSEIVGLGLGASLAALYALILEPQLMAAALNFILVLTLSIEILAALTMNLILAGKRGRFLQDFYERKLPEEEIEQGFFQLVKLPTLQALLIFMRLGIGLVILLAYLHFRLNAALINILSTFIFAFFGIYIASLASYLIIFKIIERPLQDMIGQGHIRPEVIEENKYFGISFKSRTVLFLLVPVLVGYINILFLSGLFLTESSFLVFKSRLMQMLLINSASFLLGFFILYSSQKRIIKNLSKSVEILANSEGDLSYKIPTALEDEFGYISFHINTAFQNFSQLIGKLENIARQSKDLAGDLEANSARASGTIEEIAATMNSFQHQTQTLNNEITQTDSTATEIKDFINRVNRRIEDQAASVAESSASVEQTLASINNLTQIAENKRDLINNLSQMARVGENNMSDMLMSIEDISKSAGTILEMIDVINGVAKETSLLAMNAAIEAAHAGEYGRGFAVVADEISKLSEATGSNAKTISTSLTEIINNIQKSAQVSKDTVSSISQIIMGITEVADSITEMVTGMQEISSGSSEVIKSLTNLVQLTEDVRRSAQEMDDRASSIEQTMNQISQYSEKNAADLTEIGSGLDQINESIELLADLGARNSENLAALAREISPFESEEPGPPVGEEHKLLVEKP